MKRCYLGAGVLAALLILGIFSSRWMENRYGELENQMRLAAREERPEQLLFLAEEVRIRWERSRAVTSVLADHQNLERLEEAFSQIPAAAAEGNRGKCTQLCLEIAHVFGLLAEEQRLKWENLL